MSLFELKMPKLGESVTEGTIGKWLKQPGEKVEKYDLLVEVQTDKVNTEIPSPVAGTLRDVKVKEGDTVPIGALLATFETAESAAEASAPATPAAAPARPDNSPSPSASRPAPAVPAVQRPAQPTPPPAATAPAPRASSTPVEPPPSNGDIRPPPGLRPLAPRA